jgi:predicted secreted protein
MKKKNILIFCSLLLLGACSHKKVEFDTKSGKTNTVLVGKKFTVTLIENHSKNYYWSLKQNSNKKAVDYWGSVFHGDKSGEVDFNFEALQAGTTQLTFNLNHYKDTTETKVFKIEVVK